MVLTRTVHK